MGKNLPCVDAVEDRGSLIYNQTTVAASEAYNDRIIFPVGPTCPLERSASDPGALHFDPKDIEDSFYFKDIKLNFHDIYYRTRATINCGYY